MAIESGFALAQILRNWSPSAGDLGSAFQFFQDIRKPRTDRVTETSYETGKMSSCSIPEDTWAETFKPEVIRDRMRWVMEYDLFLDIQRKLMAKEQGLGKNESGQSLRGVAQDANYTSKL